jgi:hypothetical protein
METFSYHLAFAAGRMDIPGFITRCAEFGLDGVQLNMGHLGPFLKSNPAAIGEIRELTAKFGMFVEVDTWGTDPAHLTEMLRLQRSVPVSAGGRWRRTARGGSFPDRRRSARSGLGHAVSRKNSRRRPGSPAGMAGKVGNTKRKLCEETQHNFKMILQ